MTKLLSSRAALLASALFVSQMAFAQGPAKIGVINLQAAMVNTQEGQAAATKLQDEFVTPRTAELEALDKEIKDLTDRLSRGSNTMSDTAKADMQRDIDAKTKSFNRSVEDYQADSEEQQRVLLDDLSSKMRTVISSYLQQNGYSILLDSLNPNSGLVWASESIDITQEIIAAYDAAHPVAGAAAAPAQPGTPAPAKPAPAQPGTPATPAQ